MFDFNDILTRNIDEIAYSDVIRHAIKAIMTGDIKDLPTVEETYKWPDGIWKPKNEEELKELVGNLPESLWKCNLNWIDTSEITSMSHLFFNNIHFNGDISRWDVRNVEWMELTFSFSFFNGDISNWDVSNIKNFNAMFYNSLFHQDLSAWVLNGCMTKETAEWFNLLKYMPYV